MAEVTLKNVANLNREKLNHLYWIEKLSIHEIAKSFNVSYETLRMLLRRYGIRVRSKSEAMKLFFELHPEKCLTDPMIWKEHEINFLEENFDKLTHKELAQKLNRPLASVYRKTFKLGLKRLIALQKKPINLSLLQQTDFAYIAAFIDGEGTITIGRSKKRLFPHVEVCNTDKEVIDWFSKVFNKTESRILSQKTNSQNPCYRASLYGIKDCLVLLKTIYPYLKINRKRRLAELVMQFCNLRLEKLERNYSTPHSFEEFKLYNEVRNLNRKGAKE